MKNYVTVIFIIVAFVIGYIFANEFNVRNDPLVVMSFNIRYNNPGDGDNSWPNRIGIVSSMIRFHQADIIGTQEVLKGQIDDLAPELTSYDWFGVGRDDGIEGGEFATIFYKKDRFIKLDGSTFWLSPTPEIPSKGWDSALNRIVTWIKFKDKVSNKVFYFFNTHFDHRGQTAREESASLIIEKVSEIAGEYPVIVTGDFNSVEDSTPISILTGRVETDFPPLIDSKVLSNIKPHGPTGTFTGFNEPGNPGNIIDYIFIKNEIRVLRHGILSDTFDGKFPSDHMPVLAEVKIK